MCIAASETFSSAAAAAAASAASDVGAVATPPPVRAFSAAFTLCRALLACGCFLTLAAADTATVEMSCFRGAMLPADLRAVCFVRAVL